MFGVCSCDPKSRLALSPPPPPPKKKKEAKKQQRTSQCPGAPLKNSSEAFDNPSCVSGLQHYSDEALAVRREKSERNPCQSLRKHWHLLGRSAEVLGRKGSGQKPKNGGMRRRIVDSRPRMNCQQSCVGAWRGWQVVANTSALRGFAPRHRGICGVRLLRR